MLCVRFCGPVYSSTYRTLPADYADANPPYTLRSSTRPNTKSDGVAGAADAPHLPAMAQKMVGEHARHHGFADRHRTDADAWVVPALGHDVGVGAVAIHGAARRQDRRCRLHREARHHRLPGGDAAQNAAGMIGQEADALIAHPHFVGGVLAR